MHLPSFSIGFVYIDKGRLYVLHRILIDKGGGASVWTCVLFVRVIDFRGANGGVKVNASLG